MDSQEVPQTAPQPNQPVDKTLESPSIPSTSPLPTTVPEPRNFLATFLLTSMSGPLALRHFYLGDKKLGWIRLGLFVGGYIWAFIMSLADQGAIASLGFIAVLVASVWAIVDFFYVYFNVKTDAQGQPLVATSRDKKWAKGIFWVTIGLIVAYIILLISLLAVGENMLRTQGGWDAFDSSSRSDFDDEFYTY